jgi:uncharacterized protein
MRDAPSNRRPTPAIAIPRDAITNFCREHRVRRLSLFGSVLRTDFSPESDIDVLVEFEAGAGVGLFEFAGMRDELAALLGRRVDLLTPASLSPHIRESVLSSSEAIYATAG